MGMFLCHHMMPPRRLLRRELATERVVTEVNEETHCVSPMESNDSGYAITRSVAVSIIAELKGEGLQE